MSQLVITGPNHPDLFGGETPTRIPIDQDLSMYEVIVTYKVTESGSRRYALAAVSEGQASKIGLDLVEEEFDDDAFDYEVDTCSLMGAIKPTQSEVNFWFKKTGGMK